MADDPYAVLGVEPSTDIAQIRKAYLAQLRQSHPDLRPGDSAAEQRTRELNRAWEQVRNRRASAPVRAAGSADLRRDRRDVRPAYSHDQHRFRLAFTSATLRVALAVVAIGLMLLAAQVG
jgi:curved DNA-binding protein CbpA